MDDGFLTVSARVWNRATEGGGREPRDGDRALSALLLAHGFAMNGGVLHAVECLDAEQLEAACRGYVRYGFVAIPDLLRYAATFVDAGPLAEIEEARLDADYATAIPDDQTLVSAFTADLERHPDAYAPLTTD
jgi:hypothetical protein